MVYLPTFQAGYHLLCTCHNLTECEKCVEGDGGVEVEKVPEVEQNVKNMPQSRRTNEGDEKISTICPSPCNRQLKCSVRLNVDTLFLNSYTIRRVDTL